MNSSKKEVFAQGQCFYKLFLIFVIFSIFGSYFEKIQYLIVHYLKTKTLVWPSRTAVIYGQFNMIYGFGAVLFILLLNRKVKSPYKLFLEGSIAGGAIEYTMSLLLEVFVGTKSWDYSSKFLNIAGRTTIPIMLVWGLLSLVLIKIIYPRLSRCIERIPNRPGTIITNILLVLLAADMLLSWSALLRQNLRRKGIAPFTIVGKVYDRAYPDEYLSKVYPNMVYTK